jgi:hypothetical protein
MGSLAWRALKALQKLEGGPMSQRQAGSRAPGRSLLLQHGRKGYRVGQRWRRVSAHMSAPGAARTRACTCSPTFVLQTRGTLRASVFNVFDVALKYCRNAAAGGGQGAQARLVSLGMRATDVARLPETRDPQPACACARAAGGRFCVYRYSCKGGASAVGRCSPCSHLDPEPAGGGAALRLQRPLYACVWCQTGERVPHKKASPFLDAVDMARPCPPRCHARAGLRLGRRACPQL